MTNDVSKIGSNLQQSLSTSTSATAKKQVTSKDEFLTMLVEQLKNQDPMDPMKPDQFAVNLAQFSQLEQLVNINSAIEKGGMSGGGASLAAYLGQEVAYASDTVKFENNDAGKLLFTLPSEAANVRVEILNIDGSVKETKDLGPLGAGRHNIALSGMATASGEYGVRVIGRGYSGEEGELPFAVGGIVTGFIPGADPSLLIGDRELKPSDIQQVNAASSAAKS